MSNLFAPCWSRREISKFNISIGVNYFTSIWLLSDSRPALVYVSFFLLLLISLFLILKKRLIAVYRKNSKAFKEIYTDIDNSAKPSCLIYQGEVLHKNIAFKLLIPGDDNKLFPLLSPPKETVQKLSAEHALQTYQYWLGIIEISADRRVENSKWLCSISPVKGKRKYMLLSFEKLTGRAIKSNDYLKHCKYFQQLDKSELSEQLRIWNKEGSFQYDYSAMMVEIDQFNYFRNELDESHCKIILQSLVLRFSARLPKQAIVCCLESDEILILICHDSNLSNMEFYAKIIENALEAPVEIEEKLLYFTANIGVSACSCKIDEELLYQSRQALDDAKHSGSVCYAKFIPSPINLEHHPALQQAKLKRGIEKLEFTVNYQAKVDLRNSQPVGCEALVRWNPKNTAAQSPEEFIPLAERTGLISKIGRIILEQVCAQLDRWAREGAGHLTVALNVSPFQLQNSDFIEQLNDTLRHYDFDRHLLEFEITESLLLKNPEVAIKSLSELRALGHKIHIDDFGTGYSSLSYLADLPIDCVKIDRSFIQQIPSDRRHMHIVETIVQLAQQLGIEVVAEGVETLAQCDALKRAGCHIGQGFLYGKPVSAKAFTQQYLLKTGLEKGSRRYLL